MLDKILQKLKNKPLCGFYIFLTALLSVVFMSLLSFCILQSDDYAYAAYLKDGIVNFISLTAKHFYSVNGRAFVHFMLQITLVLPLFSEVLVKMAVLFSICFLSLKLLNLKKDNIFLFIYPSLFFIVFMLSGRDTLKETLMWSSGFFNYIFPALTALLALYFLDKNTPFSYIASFLAGATTEQWGIASAVMIAVYLYLSARDFRARKSLKRYVPVLFSLAGYGTIYLSPATLSRLFTFGHANLTESLFDISRLSKAFFTSGSCVVLILLFVTITTFTAFIKEGAFRWLTSGLLPLALILLLPFHGSYMATFLVTLCYVFLCGAVFFVRKEAVTSALFFGAFAAILIMLPTNTFDARITFPGAFLLAIASLFILSDIPCSKKISLIQTLSLLLVASVLFAPCYMGFYGNSLVEKQNINAIHEAQQSKSLNYCIDYDKNFALRQMFNDGSFYNSFVSLYDLEDCTIYLDSTNSTRLSINGNILKAKAIISDGDIYVPVRAFLNEAGGSISTTDGVVITHEGKTLTYLNGMFIYTSSDGQEEYLVADKNKLIDFYTLYIKLDVINEAFNISIKAL